MLASPGWFFAADEAEPPTNPNVEGHMRMSYSTADVRSLCVVVLCVARSEMLILLFLFSNDAGGVDEEGTEDICGGCAGGTWAVEW